jgi:hypothetical protein
MKERNFTGLRIVSHLAAIEFFEKMKTGKKKEIYIIPLPKIIII